MTDPEQQNHRLTVGQRIRVLPNSAPDAIEAGREGVITKVVRNPFTGQTMFQVQLDDGTRVVVAADELAAIRGGEGP